jgi:hypothetical protein
MVNCAIPDLSIGFALKHPEYPQLVGSLVDWALRRAEAGGGWWIGRSRGTSSQNLN